MGNISRRSFVKGVGLLAGSGLDSRIWPQVTSIHSADSSSEASASAVPIMVATDFSSRFPRAYLSNGLIGTRPEPNPLTQASTAVSGFVHSSIRYQMQALAPAPYPLMLDIEANGERMLSRPELVKTTRQALDMATGELTTEMTFATGGTRWKVRVLQFACRSVPSLLCQEVRFTPSQNVSVALIPAIGSRGVPGKVYRSRAPQQTEIDLAMGFRSDLSELGIAIFVSPERGMTRKSEPVLTEEGIQRRYMLEIKAGTTCRFQTIAAMVSKYYHPEPELQAIRMASWGGVLGFDALRRENREHWNDLWQSRVKITGDMEAQRVLDAAFFYLHSSVSPSNMTGMPPFGLSQTRYYYGHSFWDTETWSLLPITLTSPAAGRALLEFRVRSLPYARKLAALYGSRGAQFPWEAAPVGGFDVTPTFAATGWEEQHITPDVALGFWEYQLATGNQDFLRHATWPVLKAVAQWIASRGQFTSRGFEIDNIMGPDEGMPDLNNNTYVNLISKMVLEAATQCAAKVGSDAPAEWQRAAATMYLPIDHKTQVVLPFDNPPKDKNYPIGGLDMLTVHDPPIDRELVSNTFNLEEKLRSGRRPAIGFASAAAAATAAWLGHRARALSLFNVSWRADWIQPFGMIKESPVETYGCFLTTFGSLLQTAMLGFTGLRIREKNWAAYPATLPQGWTQIEIDRIWVRGKARKLVADNGRPAQLTETE